MRQMTATALLGMVAFAAVPATQTRTATSLERPFAPGGSIRMDLSAGQYEIAGSPDGRIRMDWNAGDRARLDEVEARIDTRGSDATLTIDGPQNNFEVRIQVPSRSNLHVRLTAGELAIKGIEGDKDVELHAGELDIDVRRADDYKSVDAGIWAGELHASPFSVVKEGLFRSFDWSGRGRYRLHAHLKAGELRLHAAPPLER
jgi:hypothetical protein